MAQRRLRQLIKICHQTGAQVILETHDDWATSQQVLELVIQKSRKSQLGKNAKQKLKSEGLT